MREMDFPKEAWQKQPIKKAGWIEQNRIKLVFFLFGFLSGQVVLALWKRGR
jgi:hypothetical protein